MPLAVNPRRTDMARLPQRRGRSDGIRSAIYRNSRTIAVPREVHEEIEEVAQSLGCMLQRVPAILLEAFRGLTPEQKIEAAVSVGRRAACVAMIAKQTRKPSSHATDAPADAVATDAAATVSPAQQSLQS